MKVPYHNINLDVNHYTLHSRAHMSDHQADGPSTLSKSGNCSVNQFIRLMVNLPKKAVKHSFHSLKVIYKKLMVYISYFKRGPWHLPT